MLALAGAFMLLGIPAAYAGYCLYTPRGETQSCVCENELECQFMYNGCVNARGRWQCYRAGAGGGCSLAVCTLIELVSEPPNMSLPSSPPSKQQLMSPVDGPAAPAAPAAH